MSVSAKDQSSAYIKMVLVHMQTNSLVTVSLNSMETKQIDLYRNTKTVLNVSNRHKSKLEISCECGATR